MKTPPLETLNAEQLRAEQAAPLRQQEENEQAAIVEEDSSRYEELIGIAQSLKVRLALISDFLQK